MTDDSNIRERRFPVEANRAGWRLDQFLADRLTRLTRARAADIAKHGDITIEPDRRVKPGTKLKYGDVVVLREHLPPEEIDDAAITILFEDEFCLAVNKPPGILVHEASRVRLRTITGFLERAGYEEAEPVHRIDKETSGVLLCAKTRVGVPILRGMFATDHPEKVYRAIALDPEEFWKVGETSTITIPLGLDPEGLLGVRMGVGDLAATTHVTVLQRDEDLVDLEITIETGRQHQIRVHLAMQGTAIAGDKLYRFGDDFFREICADPENESLLSQLRFPRHALHAWRLSFKHPETEEKLLIEAPLPDFWTRFTS